MSFLNIKVNAILNLVQRYSTVETNSPIFFLTNVRN